MLDILHLARTPVPRVPRWMGIRQGTSLLRCYVRRLLGLARRFGDSNPVATFGRQGFVPERESKSRGRREREHRFQLSVRRVVSERWPCFRFVLESRATAPAISQGSSGRIQGVDAAHSPAGVLDTKTVILLVFPMLRPSIYRQTRLPA